MGKLRRGVLSMWTTNSFVIKALTICFVKQGDHLFYHRGMGIGETGANRVGNLGRGVLSTWEKL